MRTKAKSRHEGRGKSRRNGNGSPRSCRQPPATTLAQAVPPKNPPEADGGCLPRKATFTALGLGGHKTETAVMTPRVPSDPMKSCFRS